MARKAARRPTAPALPPDRERLVLELARFGHTLSEPTRVRILLLLAADVALTVSELTSRLGLSQPLVSSHLAILRAAELVVADRDGRHRTYRLATGRLGSLLERILQLDGPIERLTEFPPFALLYHPTR